VIAAAAVLVLLGLGLFVAGIATGVTVLYWACVVACVVAAVLLIAVRRRIATKTPTTSDAASPGAPAGPAPAGAAPTAPGPADTAAPETPPPGDELDPGVEEVEVTDLLIVVDLRDEVLVVDEHPRYHLAGCSWLSGRETIPIPLDEARTDGFTPCAVCSPDRTLAERARSRK
jgi:hypothetical protein